MTFWPKSRGSSEIQGLGIIECTPYYTSSTLLVTRKPILSSCMDQSDLQLAGNGHRAHATTLTPGERHPSHWQSRHLDSYRAETFQKEGEPLNSPA